jgi:hypothetical protein
MPAAAPSAEAGEPTGDTEGEELEPPAAEGGRFDARNLMRALRRRGHIVYAFEVAAPSLARVWRLRKTYSEFQALHARLRV